MVKVGTGLHTTVVSKFLKAIENPKITRTKEPTKFKMRRIIWANLSKGFYHANSHLPNVRHFDSSAELYHIPSRTKLKENWRSQCFMGKRAQNLLLAMYIWEIKDFAEFERLNESVWKYEWTVEQFHRSGCSRDNRLTCKMWLSFLRLVCPVQTMSYNSWIHFYRLLWYHRTLVLCYSHDVKYHRIVFQIHSTQSLKHDSHNSVAIRLQFGFNSVAWRTTS